MFDSTVCSRQFHRYDLEYIKLLPALSRTTEALNFSVSVTQLKFSKV